MRKVSFPSTAIVAVLVAFLGSGCSADPGDVQASEGDSSILDATRVELTSPTNLQLLSAGEVVLLQMKAENILLVDPKENPPPGREAEAGHFAVYFDDLSGAPLARTADDLVDVVIPESAYLGSHKLICAISRPDGTPTQAAAELALTVKFPSCR